MGREKDIAVDGVGIIVPVHGLEREGIVQQGRQAPATVRNQFEGLVSLVLLPGGRTDGTGGSISARKGHKYVTETGDVPDLPGGPLCAGE